MKFPIVRNPHGVFISLFTFPLLTARLSRYTFFPNIFHVPLFKINPDRLIKHYTNRQDFKWEEVTPTLSTAFLSRELSRLGERRILAFVWYWSVFFRSTTFHLDFWSFRSALISTRSSFVPSSCLLPICVCKTSALTSKNPVNVWH